VCARELGCSFFNIRLPDVIKSQVGVGERQLRAIMESARQAAPSIVFIDEFQAMFTTRKDERSGGSSSEIGSSLSSALAGCFDDILIWNSHAGAESMVTVLAATNEPWAVDRGFLRPGRFGSTMYIGPLDTAGRSELLMRLLSQVVAENTAIPIDMEESAAEKELVESIVAQTDGATGAEIEFLVRQSHINMRDEHHYSRTVFLRACLEILRRAHLNMLGGFVDHELIRNYEQWSPR